MNSARTALFWSFTEKYLGAILTLGSSVVLARLLTPAEIGLFSMCAAVMAVAATVRDFGVGEFIVQTKSLTDEVLRSAYAVAIITAWSIGLVIFFASQPIAAHYGEPRIVSIIHVLSLNFLILPFATPAYALLSREMAFQKLFLAQMAATLAQTVTAVTLAMQGFGPLSLAWGSTAGIVAQALVVTLARPRTSFLLPSLVNVRPVFAFGFYQVSSRVLESVTSNAHEFIIAQQFGFAKVGLFSRAKGLVDLFHHNVTAAIGRVATPSLAAAVRTGESLAEKFSQGTALFTGLSWPFFCFLALAAPEIIRVLFGPQWDLARPIASGLAIAMLPTALFALSGNVLSSMGKVKRRLGISLVWCPLHLAGLLLAAWMGGFEALPLVWGVTNTAIALLFARQLRSVLKCRYRDLFSASLRSLPAALATAVLAGAGLFIGRVNDWHALPTLALGIVFGSAGWIGGLWLVGHALVAELRSAGARVSLTLRRAGARAF